MDKIDVTSVLNEGWQQHEADPEGVVVRATEALADVADAGELAGLARLIAHTAGDHLGRWSEGIAILSPLVEHTAFEDATADARAVWRSLAVLHQLEGNDEERARCAERAGDPAHPPASTEVAILGSVTGALLQQRRNEDALASFRTARELAQYGPSDDDPAARALAIAGNNLALELEGREARTAVEDEFLRLAATTAREFWAVAGGPTEVERAEYRLACTHLALGEPERAVEHAERCHAICSEHELDSGEGFFAHEILARARFAAGDTDGAKAERERAAARLTGVADQDFRSYCEGALSTLDKTLEGR